jgi:hypothetical protein
VVGAGNGLESTAPALNLACGELEVKFLLSTRPFIAGVLLQSPIYEFFTFSLQPPMLESIVEKLKSDLS